MAELPLIDPAEPKQIALSAETQYAPNGIVSRTLMRTGSSRLVLFGFSAGQELTEHTSPYQALVQALSGECEFRISGRPYILRPGDLLSMPPNAPHSLKATTEFSMLLTLLPPAPVGSPAPK